MKKNKISEDSKDNESMLTQKTNEDFNKKQPVPNDFKKKKRGENTNSSVNLKRKKNEK